MLNVSSHFSMRDTVLFGIYDAIQVAAKLTAILDFTQNSDPDKEATVAKFTKLCLRN